MLKPLWIAGMPGALFDKVTNFCSKNSEALTEKISQVQHRLSRQLQDRTPVESSGSIDLAGEIAGILPEAAGGRKKADTKFFCADASLVWTYESWDGCLAGSYLLFYQSPLSVLKSIQGKSDLPDLGTTLRQAMENWLAYHQKFLDIYHAHPKKALLLRLDDTTEESAAALRKKLEGSKSFAKGILPEAFFACLLNEANDFGQDAAADEEFLLTALAQAYPECHQLFLNLEAAALPVGIRKKELAELDLKTLSLKALEQQLVSLQLVEKNKIAAQQLRISEERHEAVLADQLKTQKMSKVQQTEHKKIIADMEALAKEKERCLIDKQAQLDLVNKREQQIIDVQAELELALLQLHQLQESLEVQALLQKDNAIKLAAAEKDNKHLLANHDAQAVSLKKHEDRVIELQNESELMLLQLHQVQEECETQFLLQKTLAGKLELCEKEKNLLLLDQKRLSDSLANAEAKIVELINKKKSMQAQLHEAQKGHENHLLTQKALAEKQAALEKEKNILLAEKETQISELRSDSELMLLQLHQVQEELELYFLECERVRGLLESYRKSERETRQLISKLLKPHLTGRG